MLRPVRRQGFQRGMQIVDQRRRIFPGFACPKALNAGFGGGRGEGFGKSDMGIEQRDGRHAGLPHQLGERTRRVFEIFGPKRQSRFGFDMAKCGVQPGESWNRPGAAEDRKFHFPHPVAKRRRLEPTGGKWMFQRRQQRHGGGIGGDRICRQTQEHAG